MRSAPNQPLWKQILKLCEERATPGSHPVTATGPGVVTDAMWTCGIQYHSGFGYGALDRTRDGFHTRSFLVRDLCLLHQLVCGPQFAVVHSLTPADLQHEGRIVKYYGLGSWFYPCWFEDKPCLKRMAAASKAGLFELDQAVGKDASQASQPWMEGLVGQHLFSFSWGP